MINTRYSFRYAGMSDILERRPGPILLRAYFLKTILLITVLFGAHDKMKVCICVVTFPHGSDLNQHILVCHGIALGQISRLFNQDRKIFRAAISVLRTLAGSKCARAPLNRQMQSQLDVTEGESACQNSKNVMTGRAFHGNQQLAHQWPLCTRVTHKS